MTESAKRQILHTANLDLAAIAAAGAVEDSAVVVPGVKPGDVVSVSAPTLDAGLVATGFVSDVDEVTVRVTNTTAAPVNPADNMDFFIAVTR